MKSISKLFHSPRFLNGLSWGLTGVIVAALVGFTLWKILPARAQPNDEPNTTQEPGTLATLPIQMPEGGTQAIVRFVALDTSFDEDLRYEVSEYTVQRGDTVSSIAAEYGLLSGSLMWANDELMQDGPNSLRVGQALLIPPVDGVLYQWEEEDTLAGVAEAYQSTEDEILLWPGNNIDLSNPVIEVGAYVMIPGGKSDAIQWTSPVIASGSSGTSTGSATTCGGDGPMGGGGTLMWPSPYHYINGGNQYGGSHLAIDLYGPEGTNIVAADSGVVVWSSYGAWNGGYGNVVMINHRNGFSTLYGHLSQVNVGLCEWVYAGGLIGLSGNTGNSFGAHLHFEVRYGGGYLNPWDYLPPP